MNIDSIGVLLTANSSFLDNNKGQLFEVRQARLARMMLDQLGAAKALSISGDLRRQEANAQASNAGTAATSSTQATVSSLGLADAVKMMEARCERK